MLLPVVLSLVATIAAFAINSPLKIEDEKWRPCIEKSGFQIDKSEDFGIKDTPTIELLCLMQCIVETLGVVDENGQIVEDKIDDFETGLPDEKQSLFKDCVMQSPEIKSCQDMDYMLQCLASV